jgi:ketosteroid isomerase-like protein
MEHWELAAREAVRDLVARYAHLVDRGRLDEVAALFTDDAVLEAGDLPPARGRAAIRSLFADTGGRLAAGGAPALIRHHVTSVQVDVLGPDDAEAASYFQALTAGGLDHWGRYRDRVVRRDAIWRLAYRAVRIDGRSRDVPRPR